MPEQLFFDLDFPNRREAEQRRRLRANRRQLRRAVVRWFFADSPPAACAVDVVTRISRIRADVAAFWNRSVRNPHAHGPRQILEPTRTVIVECHLQRDECWPDCARALEILPKLREYKARLVEVENRIREREPHLRADGSLFEEMAEWRYEDTRDREYHRLKRQIDKAEHALYHGTKFERIRSAALADLLYLAVPAGTVQSEELADGWGLLWVQDDLTVTVAAPAQSKDCLPENRLHLVQNIAAAASRAVLFREGIRTDSKGRRYFVRPPRAHRKPEPGLAVG
ncbi:MAG: hypothetical protein GXP31_10135 [Kiritimatiellaeota bacterium]|nr:hypothetical protein [Kiritimatiellota bacterium]